MVQPLRAPLAFVSSNQCIPVLLFDWLLPKIQTYKCVLFETGTWIAAALDILRFSYCVFGSLNFSNMHPLRVSRQQRMTETLVYMQCCGQEVVVSLLRTVGGMTPLSMVA